MKNKRNLSNRKLWLMLGFLLGFVPLLKSQSSFFIGTQIPLSYNLGYELQLNDKWSVSSQFGVLTNPYDKAIIEILKAFGTDEQIVNTIGDAFSYGLDFQPEIVYNFKKWEFGIIYSYYFLKAKDAPKDAIESYYGVTFPFRPRIGYQYDLTLTSGLHNAGIKIGRKFFLKNPSIEIRTEFDFAKTFASKSILTANEGDVSRISDEIDKELNDYYLKYGYLPALNIRLVYHINAKK